MDKTKKNSRKSFSLVEVLVFTSILSLFFVTAAAVVTESLRNMKINEHKILATRYAEELLEWLRSKKEADWDKFVEKGSVDPGTVYCFNAILTDDWPQAGKCSPENKLDNIFTREVTLKNEGAPVNYVQISILVSWEDTGNSYQVPIKTVFTLWE